MGGGSTSLTAGDGMWGKGGVSLDFFRQLAQFLSNNCRWPTGAAFSHITYISQYIQPAGLAENEEDFALGFFVPFNVPGLT